MGRVVTAIVGAVMVVAGVITANPQLILQGTLMVASALAVPKAPKPQAAETTLKSPTSPRIFGYGTRRVYGSYAFFGNTTTGASVDVIAYCDCPANSVDAVYINDDAVTISGGYVQSPDGEAYRDNAMLAGYNLGATPETAHAAVVSALPSVWTSDHRGDGVVSGYLIKLPVKDKNFASKYPQGDNVQVSLVINMQPVFDPREVSHDIDDESTWAASANPVLHFLHYLVFNRGYSYTNNILPKIAMWQSAADVCDETISGEARYRACLLFERTARPHEIIASILETFDGWYSVDSLGHISIYAGEYYTPSVTIGASHIVEYSCQSFVEDENKYNEISVKYFSAEHDYNEVEAQPWRDEADISERGIVNSTGVAPQVPSFKQSRRLAKILMARNNAQYRGQIMTNYAGRIAEGHRFINLQIIEAGAIIFNGVAEITGITRNLETGGITFDWVNVDANAWAWNPATEDGYGAPTGVYPTIDALVAPTADTATYLFDANANTANLTVSGTGPDRADLTWFLRWRYDGGAVWNEQRYDDIAAGAAVTLVAGIVPVNTNLEVQIAYATGNGSVSDWSNTLDTNADTESEPPQAAGAVTLASWNGSINLTTTPIARASSYRWKVYASDGTTLKRTIDTVIPSASYTLSQASSDGVARAYKVTVEGVNGAGSGTASAQLTITKPAPAAVTGISATDGDYSTTITFTPNSAASGNIVFYSDATGFDPKTDGRQVIIGNTGSYIIDNLVADTYYFIIAPIDNWTTDPDFLNLSAEYDFTIAIGGGGTGADGGGWEGGTYWEGPGIEP